MISGVQNLLTLIQHFMSSSEMNVCWGQKSNTAVMMFVVIPAEKFSRPTARIRQATKTCWIIRAVFQSFKLTSENGLSLETCGRECVLVTPKSDMSNATGFEVIELPLSA